MSTSYTLYNREAVERLLRDDPDLLPAPRVNIPKDMRWNKNQVNSSVLQGILQGEPMDKIARRMYNVCGMDAKAAIRNARTAVTGAENAGRLDSMKRAQAMGVQLQKLWLATRDQRTRDSHVLLDGEQVDLDEKFSNGCRYPGDPQGAPGEVYNCRCAMRSKVKGANPYSPDLSRNERLGGMSYEEWKQEHGDRFYTRLFSENNLAKAYQNKGKSIDFQNAKSGEPILEKEIDFNNKEAVLAELRSAQLSADNLDYEINCSITSDGKVWLVKGEGSAVNPSAIPSDLKGSYSFHNHPTERSNYSFGASDTGFFLSSGEQYSVASDKIYEYIMERTPETPDVDFDTGFHRFDEYFNNEVMEMAWKDGLDLEHDGYHETMKLLSKEFHFIYKRRKRNEDQ